MTFDFLLQRFPHPTGCYNFVGEFSMIYDSWKKKRPMVFAISLLGLLVIPLEDRHISTCPEVNGLCTFK